MKVVFFALLTVFALPGIASARTRLYAVVIAQNRSLDPGVRPLRYADDDGVNNWELLSLYATRASLFVVMDEETARLHPQAARSAEVPDRAAILARLREYDVEMQADVKRGDDPELFFVYAGHGDVDAAGQGYINLNDGRFTRSDLFHDVIAPSKARFTHVIIDACKSYFMVSARGGGNTWKDDSVDPAHDRGGAEVRAFLAEEELERYPRAGVIVATSGAEETHEWSRYQGGILSHELRSALTGAADVNGDGRIEYSELRAFLAAANARVTNPEARLQVFSRPPPLDRHHPLIDLRAAEADGRLARFLHFGPGLSGRFDIEDERGVRYADLNKEASAAFDVAVSAKHTYFVRRSSDLVDDREEVEVPTPGRRRVEVARLDWKPCALAARGALDQSFRHDLYRVPFGRGFYDGFIATSGDLPVDDGMPFVVAGPRELPKQNRLSLGYLFSGAPAGQAGYSHAVDVRYAHRLGRFFDLGVAAQIGHGDAGDSDPARDQSLTRFALLGVAGVEYAPIRWLALRLDGAIGWQLLSGAVELGGTRVVGTEGRGLRLEAAGGLGFNAFSSLWIFARGGLAVDGVWPGAAASSLSPSGFFNISAQIRL
jgi:hypothetical protein